MILSDSKREHVTDFNTFALIYQAGYLCLLMSLQEVEDIICLLTGFGNYFFRARRLTLTLDTVVFKDAPLPVVHSP